MSQRGATDLYLVVGSPLTFRIDGKLIPLTQELIKPKQIEELIAPLLTEELRNKLVEDKEVEIAYSIKGLSRFRINIFFQRGTLGAAIKILPPRPPTLDEINAPVALKKMAALTSGLVIISGPAASGKTTTLAALIDFINETRNAFIVTIESPIEFLHKNKKSIICQRELGSDVITIERALQGIASQSPDVIVVGELNQETIERILSLANAGILVITSVRVAGVFSTLQYIIESAPLQKKDAVRILLGNCIEGVFSQVLASRIKGRGRLLAMEYLIPNSRIKRFIKEGDFVGIQKTLSSVQKDVDYKSIEVILRDYYQKGLISREEAIAKAYHPQEMEKIIDRTY